MFNRRRNVVAGPAPSFKTLIRQLRMTDLSHADDGAISRFRLRLAAAVKLAEATADNASADELARLLSRIDAESDARAHSAAASETLALVAARLI